MALMAMMRCPTTGQMVATGITFDRPEYFETFAIEDSTFEGCPACGGNHPLDKSQMSLAAS
jgi:hypothetical protein